VGAWLDENDKIKCRKWRNGEFTFIFEFLLSMKSQGSKGSTQKCFVILIGW
jgi:hypothetical protein